MKKRCKGSLKTQRLAELIEVAIKNKQRVWYSEVYNTWLTQKYTIRHNYILMFDFTKKQVKNIV